MNEHLIEVDATGGLAAAGTVVKVDGKPMEGLCRYSMNMGADDINMVTMELCGPIAIKDLVARLSVSFANNDLITDDIAVMVEKAFSAAGCAITGMDKDTQKAIGLRFIELLIEEDGRSWEAEFDEDGELKYSTTLADGTVHKYQPSKKETPEA